MKTLSAIALATLALATGIWVPAAHADTADANCQVRKRGELAKDASGPCTFSQRQGYIDIRLRNGGSYSLSPGERANHYKDQNGHGVERTAAVGDSHTYKWDKMQIVVTFGGAASGGEPAVGDPPSDLKDLVKGKKLVGGEVDDELTRRGYQSVRSEVSGDDLYSYWRKASTGGCAIVRFDKSRHVASVAAAPATDCK